MRAGSISFRFSRVRFCIDRIFPYIPENDRTPTIRALSIAETEDSSAPCQSLQGACGVVIHSSSLGSSESGWLTTQGYERNAQDYARTPHKPVSE